MTLLDLILISSNEFEIIKDSLSVGVNLLAVSKGNHHGSIRKLSDYGQLDFGESRLQEAIPKKNNLNDLCASIQHSIIKILLDKIIIASKETKISNIAIAGGVSANSYLRKKLNELARETDFKIYIPKFEYCTDNGAMVAYAGYLRIKKGHSEPLSFHAKPRWPIDNI